MTYKNGYHGKTVLITGHTGFKGAWLTAWLKKLGANVVGLALDPSTTPSHYVAANLNVGISDYRVDIRNKEKIESIFVETKPDFVFHLAAQALVRKSYDAPIETWETNLIGTLHILEALRKIKNKCSAVIITSDKCYDNVEWIWGYRETDALGGADPYSASKGAAELVIKSHIKSFFTKENSDVSIVSARAGNVIGGGDWSPDRIIPDCIKAWANNDVALLRSPNATRPWQHVLEPLSGYLQLAIFLSNNNILHGESFNFGPSGHETYSVLELVRSMALHWSSVKWSDVSLGYSGPYESNLLKLNCDKAHTYLNWHSVMSFDDTVKMTADWYRKFYEDSSDVLSLTNSQIDHFTTSAKYKGLGWAQ